MVTTTDPYAALGIPSDAAPAAVRSSYKKLILQCHPDKVHDEGLRAEKAAQFQKVQEAYELLNDSRRRRKYDEEVARRKHGSGRDRERERDRDRDRDRDRERERDKEREREREKERDRGGREDLGGSGRRRHGHADGRSSYDHSHPHYPEEERERSGGSGSRHKSYSHRYSEESPRKQQPFHSPPHHIPKEPPLSSRQPSAQEVPEPSPQQPQQQQPEEAVRPGYLEMKAAEKAKIDGIRRKTGDESHSKDDFLKPPSPARGGSRLGAGVSSRLEREKREAEAELRRERPRESSGGLGRSSGTDLPRERKSPSRSPPTRRGSSSTTSRIGEDLPSTPMNRPFPYGSSAPNSHPAYPPSHMLNPNHHNGPRRRHSSPSIEKQAQRMQRDVPCDSGYSSPSTDTPPGDKKMPSPGSMPGPGVVRAATAVHEGFDRSGVWRKYTLYVREDETVAPSTGVPPPPPSGVGPIPPYAHPHPHPHHHHHHSPYRRGPSSTTSPSLRPSDPVRTSPLAPPPPQPVSSSSIHPPTIPPEFIEKVTGIPFPYASSTLDPRYSPPTSSAASPPRMSRHSHGHSPKLAQETFGVPQPGIARAHTHYHPRRSGERVSGGEYWAPGLARGSTFG